jgi:hypothetical protein
MYYRLKRVGFLLWLTEKKRKLIYFMNIWKVLRKKNVVGWSWFFFLILFRIDLVCFYFHTQEKEDINLEMGSNSNQVYTWIRGRKIRPSENLSSICLNFFFNSIKIIFTDWWKNLIFDKNTKYFMLFIIFSKSLFLTSKIG